MNKMPRVSVVIPTLNDEPTLSKCLSSISNQDISDIEIIIIDGGSDDRTIDIAENYNCKILTERKGTISYAREVGVEAATGEFIAFTDADCVVPEDWLSTLLQHFDDEGEVAAVGGPNVTPSNDTSFAKSVGDVLSLLSSAGSRYGQKGGEVKEIYHNPTCNVVYRKKIITEVGGFNHNLVTVDDEEMDFRIRKNGYTILYTPNAEVLHYRRPTTRSFVKMAYTYGIGRGQVVKIHPKMGSWFHFAPSALISFLSTILSLGMKDKSYFKKGIGVLATGGIGIILMSIILAKRTKRWGQVPIYVLLISIWFWGWGIGFIMGLLRY